jgi:hypothetical protein
LAVPVERVKGKKQIEIFVTKSKRKYQRLSMTAKVDKFLVGEGVSGRVRASVKYKGK